jgi:hypothetical protein
MRLAETIFKFVFLKLNGECHEILTLCFFIFHRSPDYPRRALLEFFEKERGRTGEDG